MKSEASLAVVALAAALFVEGYAFRLGDFGGKPHIIGGVEVPSHAYPYHVLLSTETDKPWPTYCGGAMLSPEWVLTAAHCVVKEHYRATAYFGVHDRDYDLYHQAVERQALKIIHHPLFSTNPLRNDIALIKVSAVKPVEGIIAPIRLPSESQKDNSFSGWPVTITGFGHIKQGGPNSYVLRKMDTEVSTFCCGSSEVADVFNDNIICADGREYKIISQGDSGGPMVTKEEDGDFTLLGIASFTLREVCGDLHPAGFTRVTSYLDWIHKETGLKPRM